MGPPLFDVAANVRDPQHPSRGNPEHPGLPIVPGCDIISPGVKRDTTRRDTLRHTRPAAIGRIAFNREGELPGFHRRALGGARSENYGYASPTPIHKNPGDAWVDVLTEWRRGELNPRPEITRMAASTCIVDVLISVPAAAIDSLRRDPVVFISLPDQRPNQAASLLFCSRCVTGYASC